VFRDAVRAVRAVRYFVTHPVSAPRAVRGAVFRDTLENHTAELHQFFAY